MEQLNCPNCGAPIRGVECKYCGTMFYDFASIRDDRPTYIGVRVGDRNIAFRARMVSATINVADRACPEVNMDFDIYPDDKGILLYMRELK